MKQKESSTTDGYASLFKAFLALKTMDEVKSFFEDLCTPAELKDFVDRWSVVGPLQEGVPYREIQKMTGVSVTTVTRVARAMKYGSGGYILIYNRLLRAKNVKKNQVKNRAAKKRPSKQRIA